MGILAGDTNDNIREQFKILGQTLGLAFQVQDDILDITSETDTLGKPAEQDKNLDKITYPALLGLPEAKTLLLDLFESMREQLNNLNNIKTKNLTSFITWLKNRIN